MNQSEIINAKKSAKREQLFDMAMAHGVPGHTADSLVHYIVDRRPVGGFLNAVLAGDLYGAFGRADSSNFAAMGNIVRFIHNHAPAVCFGSERVTEQWVRPGSGSPKTPWEMDDELSQLADDERSEHDFAPSGPGTA